MSKKIEITNSDLVKIEPVTDNQKVVFDSYKKGKNQFLYGCAGTGKTFITLYLAMQEVLRNDTPYDRVVMVRSLIPTREIGFLPGDEEDKLHSIKFHILIWFSLCSNNQMNKRSLCCMIE